MRGENEAAKRDLPEMIGTPPHAWGKHQAGIQGGGVVRYTPTCVGKTNCIDAIGVLGKVHPHMRGENSKSRPPIRQGTGTPPHAWGKLSSLYSLQSS